MILYFLVLFTALIVTFFTMKLLIPRLKQAGITGKDLNKEQAPEVPEMGGLGIVAGFSSGILLAIGLETFYEPFQSLNLIALLAALGTVLIVSIIGIMDDLIDIRHGVKAILPIFASLPLIAVKVGKTEMQIPMFGIVNFGILYSLIIVPVGITGAANGVNMLAGFNGLEVGMGIMAISSLAYIAYVLGATTSLVLLLAMLGALIAAVYYNWYPARILIGDVGTLSIGALIATSVIIGDFESAGILIFIPYFVDFIIKMANDFPTSGWWGYYKDGKLYCPDIKPVSLCQWIMKLAGGISERDLVLFLVGIEAIFGIIAISTFML
jgi:UDP-N-acetylglucosamine--dolichyl-phosphate N-acetylglucosaminephosphotransferase